MPGKTRLVSNRPMIFPGKISATCALGLALLPLASAPALAAASPRVAAPHGANPPLGLVVVARQRRG